MSRSRMTQHCRRQVVYRSKLLNAINSLIDRRVVAGSTGTGRVWNGWAVLLAGVLMAWQQGRTLADKFTGTRVALRRMLPTTKLGRSYQGFVKALRLQSMDLMDRVTAHLRVQMPVLAGPHWTIHGWCALAVDGSRVECPRTAANERELRCAGRKRTTPQLFLTMVYHLGTGLPWSYRIGPGTDSERNHLRGMLGCLPGGGLLVADAGFVGYDLLTGIGASGRHFLIRVGSNVTLLRKLGFGQIHGPQTVWLWPDKAAKRRLPPVALRLIVLHDGKKPVYLVTNVAEPQRLSDQAAGALYRRRWGVEVFFRSFKQTLAHRQMRSDAPANARVELAWAVLGLWVLSAMTVQRMVAAGTDPGRLSVAAAIRVVRGAMGPPGESASLLEQLAGAVKDGYVRTAPKQARDWPHKKTEKPPGEPKIREATDKEVQLAKDLETPNVAA